MKKLLLLATVALASFSADAQYAGQLNIGGSKESIDQYTPRNVTGPIAGKSTASGGRWYNHAAAVDLFNGNTSSFRLWPIWFDSTVRQVFTSGLGAINYISGAQVIDPIYFTLFHDPNVFDPNGIDITAWTPYKVDSVSFSGAYVKNLNRSVNIVDTLILSVSASSTSTTNQYSYYYTDIAGDAWAGAYVSGTDTLKGFTIHRNNTDIENRASNVAGRVLWKVPLTDAMRQEDSAGFVDIQSFTFPVMVGNTPGFVDIPAGYGVAMTVTFKSGDVVAQPNVDTFTQYHNFLLFSGEALGAGQVMPYYFYSMADRNSSNLMFGSQDSAYYPSVFIEGWNTIAFRQEFHDMGAHIVCDDCPLLSVRDINNSQLETVTLYPNPADNEVNINFTMSTDANASISITNSVGQVVAQQNVRGVKAKQVGTAKFSTTNMASGIYFYTVEANGQRKTERFVVSH